jgi:glutathione-regulated potassium-efflux system ancillary protein KefC
MGGWPWQASLVMGMTMAVSSTALVMQILRERGEIASPHGSAAFGVLLMQDIAIVPMLAAIPVLAGVAAPPAGVPDWKQIALMPILLASVWAFGKYVVPFALTQLARQRNREGFLMVAMLAVFLASWATHKAGLSLALGAFLMGMLLSDSPYALQVEAYIEPYKGILMSLFFVAVGMSIDVRSIAATPLVFIGWAVAVILAKLAVTFLLCLLFGVRRHDAVSVSFLLAQGGEFGFVLVTSARALSVIDDRVFVLGIAVISVTMLFTPVMAKLGYYGAERFRRREGQERADPFPDSEEAREGRVILGGYGRVGHVVAVLLHASRVPFIAFDNDPARVAQGKRDGFPVYYGDISNPELLAAARAEQASLVVLTVDDEKTALEAITHVKSYCSTVPVIARARDLEASGRLIRAGAARALPEAMEASLRLATDALEMVGVPPDNVDLLLSDVRGKGYELVKAEE